jgi:protein-S-isoprenylcysteine O-methyltransferase Ste14
MIRRLILKLFFKTLLSAFLTALLLFGTAGTLAWPAAWVFLAEVYGCALLIGLLLAKDDPALLAERLQPLRKSAQENWDRTFVTFSIFLYYGWIAIMGLDAGRGAATRLPTQAAPIGATLLFLGMAVVYRTFRENTFTAAVVKIQKERGHHVISTGPYRFVRHPMYSGALLTFLGTALLLGSGVGLIFVPILGAGLWYRARREELTLIERLAGYSAYATHVKARFIPFVW